MRRPAHPVLAAVLAAVVALVIVGALGVASAEGPASAPVARTVGVEGVAIAPIPVQANAATANVVYREAMAKAVADGQSKASFLAAKSGAVVAAVDSVAERGGYIDCAGTSSEYAPYEGEQPDFGYGPVSGVGVAAPLAASGAPSHGVSHRPKVRHGRPTAKKAAAASCNLTAEVALVYAIG